MLIVVGTIGIDQIATPNGSRDECVGGSAIHFSYAASLFGPVRIVGIVGEDFPPDEIRKLADRGVDTTGIEIVSGKTFRWSGKYFDDMDNRETLLTELNVFGDWQPVVPEAWKDSRTLFLANGSPRTQLNVLDQTPGADLVVCDTMDLWINTERENLELLLRRVNGVVINESEALLFTGEPTLMQAGESLKALGPEFVIIKKGTHGALTFSAAGVSALPAFPINKVYDPTGAGDSFAGGLLGYLTAGGDRSPAELKRAVAYATCVASFNVEDFGADRLSGLEKSELESRFAAYRDMLALS